MESVFESLERFQFPCTLPPDMSHPSASSPHADRLEIPHPTTPNRPKLNNARPNSSRLPPPALFQGPPSRNNSHISLSPPGVPGSSLSTYNQQPRANRIPQAASFSGPSYR